MKINQPDIQRAKDLMDKEELSLVVVREGKVLFKSGQPGIKSLLRVLTSSPETLSGSFVSDRIVGKAAAFLFLLGNISGLYTPLISTEGLKLLRSEKIDLYYYREIPHVRNRNGDSICPMEKLCMDVEDPLVALELLTKKVQGGSSK